MGHPRPHILLVEDHPLLVQVMTRFLQEQGNMVLWGSVATATAALDELAAAASGEPGLPDIVIVDVSLPGMSGIDLVKELGELYPDLPCLIVSAHSDISYVRQAISNGAQGYVAKGDPMAILEAVHTVLDGGRYFSSDLDDISQDSAPP
ncbi:MAG: response regulator transcription factor [Anaerolineae bacterium]|nr:response regulator transcription factor [Anaerolineae bacterium]